MLLCGCEGVPCEENSDTDTLADGTVTKVCGSCAAPCHPYEDDEGAAA